MTSKTSRREFLRQSSALAIAGSAAPFALNLASIGAASAQVTGGYKALVCVFLYGGNDAHNTVVPAGAAYNTYAATRGTLAWPPAQLTALSAGGVQLPTAELGPLATLYEAQRCAIVANVGPLIVPTNRTSFQAKSVPLPAKLFSHNDQQSTWQASAPEGATYGWGGRIGDLLASQNGMNTTFTTINLTGNAVFLSGQQIQPYQLDPAQGAVPFNGVVGTTLYGSGAGTSALRTILTRTNANLMQNELGKVNQRSIDSQAAVSAAIAAPITPAPLALPMFNGQTNQLAQQLQMVARMIYARSALGAARQVFLVSMGGYDTHANQSATHPGLLTQLAQAIGWWQTTIDQIGIANDVTLFTASDFGRALAPNSEGSDHGWGSHHVVVGGAVAGRQVYGAYPDLTTNASTDAGNGRLIPTTSVEQYAATLARWMGVTPANLPVILPNLVNFSQQDLGFMT